MKASIHPSLVAMVPTSPGHRVPWPSLSRQRRRTVARWIRRAAATLVLYAVLVPVLITAREAQSADTRPVFLVATRDMPDPLFQETVILMLPRTDLPLVAGVIINRPTTIPVRKLFPRAALKNQSERAFFGGPVDPNEPSLILRAPQSSAALRLFDDIFMSDDPNAIAETLGQPAPAKELRLFLGRAQWTPDQLQAEMLERSWYLVQAKSELVFSHDPDSVWGLLVHRAQLQEADGPRLRMPTDLQTSPSGIITAQLLTEASR